MPIIHIFLALLVAVIWGINFFFVQLSLTEVSPLFLCALRFLLASVPAIFFISPPSMPVKYILSYGLIMFALQFALLFLGMSTGMPAGSTALIMQTQLFFSMFFASIFLKEIPDAWQILGSLISFLGIALVAKHLAGHISLLGFFLVLAAATTWGFGNLITKKGQSKAMIPLVVWGSFIATFPLFLLSLLFEGPSQIKLSLAHLTWVGGSGLLYTVFISTWIGYGAWNWLLGRYPVSTIAPFTLLVPIVGMMVSVLIGGEPFPTWKVAAVILVISGLMIHMFGRSLFMKIKPFLDNGLPQE